MAFIERNIPYLCFEWDLLAFLETGFRQHSRSTQLRLSLPIPPGRRNFFSASPHQQLVLCAPAWIRVIHPGLPALSRQRTPFVQRINQPIRTLCQHQRTYCLREYQLKNKRLDRRPGEGIVLNETLGRDLAGFNSRSSCRPAKIHCWRWCQLIGRCLQQSPK
jgi:hypothetical protein